MSQRGGGRGARRRDRRMYALLDAQGRVIGRWQGGLLAFHRTAEQVVQRG